MVAGCRFPFPLPALSHCETTKRNQTHLPPPQPTPPTRTNHDPGFRPPSQSLLRANDLELYNIRNDGWCLITLALILLSLTSAIPLSPAPKKTTPSKAVHSADAPQALKTGGANAVLPYARAVVAATVFHHLTTGVGAWQHYKLESHYNKAMGIGVWGNVWLVGAGVFTLLVAMTEKGREVGEEAERKVR